MKKHLPRYTAPALAVAAVGALIFMSVGAGAADKPNKPVARVYAVDGGKLEIQRAGKGDWSAGKKDAPGYVADHFKTDDSAKAGIELLLGGRIVVKPGSEITLLNEREAGAVEDGKVNTIGLRKGGLYAKFAKQKSGKLRIKTNGGVMGIKGTEFDCESDPDKNTTEITLIEGDVDYKDDGGNEYDLDPGEKLAQVPNSEGETEVITGAPDDVDALVAELDQLIGADLEARKRAIENKFNNLDQAALDALVATARGSRTAGLGSLGSGLTNWRAAVPNWNNWGPMRDFNNAMRELDRIPGVNTPRIPNPFGG